MNITRFNIIHFLRTSLLWSQAKELAFGCVCLILFSLSLSFLYAHILLRLFVCIVTLFFLFCLYFFRNPKRVCQAALFDNSILVSPADGVIVDIQRDSKHGSKRDSTLDNTNTVNTPDGYAHKISIFLSPLDVHVNWVPFDGIVENRAYKPGKFMCAFLPKSSEFNERHDVIFRRTNTNKHDTESVLVRQIAGTVARRICWWVSPGMQVRVGDTFGMIRFGSRVDIFLPRTVTITVSMGQRVQGGETVIGVWQ